MKHDADCQCRTCKTRTAAPPSSRITIPLADVAATVADSVRAVLEARGMSIVRDGSGVRMYATTLDGKELEAVLVEIGNNSASCLQGLDETPDEPTVIHHAARRLSLAEIDARRPRIRGRK